MVVSIGAMCMVMVVSRPMGGMCMVVSIGAMCMVDGGEQTYGGHVHDAEGYAELREGGVASRRL